MREAIYIHPPLSEARDEWPRARACHALPLSHTHSRPPTARFFAGPAGPASSPSASLLRFCAGADASAAESLPRAASCAGATLAAAGSATAPRTRASAFAASRWRFSAIAARARFSSCSAAACRSALLRTLGGWASASAAAGAGRTARADSDTRRAGAGRTARAGSDARRAGAGASAVAEGAGQPPRGVRVKRPLAGGTARSGALLAGGGAVALPRADTFSGSSRPGVDETRWGPGMLVGVGRRGTGMREEVRRVPGMLIGVVRRGVWMREDEVRREPGMLVGVRRPGAGMREEEVRREPGGAGMREEEEGRGTGAAVGVVVAVEGDMVSWS